MFSEHQGHKASHWAQRTQGSPRELQSRAGQCPQCCLQPSREGCPSYRPLGPADTSLPVLSRGSFTEASYLSLCALSAEHRPAQVLRSKSSGWGLDGWWVSGWTDGRWGSAWMDGEWMSGQMDGWWVDG